MEQQRVIHTPEGSLSYTLTRKRVKYLNLRVARGGRIYLSAPLRCPDREADAFVQEKRAWLQAVLTRRIQAVPVLLPEPAQEVCNAQLIQAMERVYPLAQALGVARPKVKIRRMKSQWGNCHWRQGYITLNTALARCPQELQDYVALHELVHFLHPNHGPGFYARMDQLMPDWLARRKQLKTCALALESGAVSPV